VCVVYIRWDAVKVVLSSRPSARHSPLFLTLTLFHLILFFLHSLLFISFASLLSLLVHVYTCRLYTERGKFRQSALYLRRGSTSGFDVLGCNAYLSRAEYVHTRVRGAILHACVRARVQYHTCTSRSRDARYGA